MLVLFLPESDERPVLLPDRMRVLIKGLLDVIQLAQYALENEPVL